MKRLLLTLIAVAATLTFNGCSRDEKTAIEEFKKDVTEFSKWSDEKQKALTDPAQAMASFGELAAKLKAIKTDGLPADLKDPWNGMLGSLDKMAALMPKDAAAAQKMMSDPNSAKDFMPKMMAIEAEVKPNVEKLQAAGKKYGIDNLDKVGPK